MKVTYLALAIIVIALLVGGCTQTVGRIVTTAASIVVKPVLGLAVKDAKTTLQWVESELQGGRLSTVDGGGRKEVPALCDRPV